MEAEVANADLLHKLESRVHLRLCVRHGAGLRAEALIRGRVSEDILARVAQVMPPCHRKGQVLAHRFTCYNAVGFIELKRKRILACGAFVTNLGDTCKNLSHGIWVPFVLVVFTRFN
ncbi:hypothetical protein SDC9_140263 [bioreactor metagenome]|uniref:Uncharacterized protein n=1 Tax=bioreactor metagenome TaxID=1076179 RepID=A0A645DUR5_9ZZZZ